MVHAVLVLLALMIMIIYSTVFFILFFHALVLASINNPYAAVITGTIVYTCMRILQYHFSISLPGGRIARRKDCECCICFDDRTDWVLPCAHKFHERCIVEWVRRGPSNSCPLCRARI